ncbi:MAG: EF-hand domain-containing protein [Pseudomonadales bacterium]
MQNPKNTLAIKLFTIVIITSASATCFAAGHGARMIEHLDTDGDNLISLDEFHPPEGRGGMLKRADLNGDGIVTIEEATQVRDERNAERAESSGRRLEKTFEQMDTNNDGAVSGDEMRLYAFNKVDKNQDGYLSEEELRNGRKHRRKQYDRWQSGEHHSHDD